MPFPLPIVMFTSLQEHQGKAKMSDNYFIPCGQICGAVREMKSAKQVVNEMLDEAVRILEEEFPARIKVSK
jgi:hypothetical protein